MIDPVRLGPVTPITASVARRADVARAVSPDAGSASRATLPRLLDLVADLAQSGPPIDYAKIAQVRRAIAEGSYRIDADALAKAILSFAREA